MRVWNSNNTRKNRISETLEKNRITLEQFGVKKGRILDWGCGKGLTTRELGKLVPESEVLGIDISQEQIDIANSRRKNKRVRFECVDGCDLENIAQGYSLITAMNNLMYGLAQINISVEEFQRVVGGLKGKLDDDGVLLLSQHYRVMIYERRVDRVTYVTNLVKIHRLEYEPMGVTLIDHFEEEYIKYWREIVSRA